MQELIDKVDDVIHRWGNIVEADRNTQDYLQEIVDILKDNLATPRSEKRGKQPSHMMLPLFIWAEISRRQIIGSTISVNSVIEFLTDAPLPNGKSYREKQLNRLYKEGIVMVGKLDPWVLSDVQGAIKASDSDENWIRKVKDHSRNEAGGYRKKHEAYLDQLTGEEQQAEAERSFLNGLRHQIHVDSSLRSREVMDDCLLGIARCRGIKLTELSREEAQAWVNAVITEL
ncbi:MAG: hypothetical protein V7720_05090 [Halioglobus sp.]